MKLRHLANAILGSISAVYLISLSPLANAQTIWTDAPEAKIQTLPHQLTLLQGHKVVAEIIADPNQPEKSFTENSFAVKVPPVSGHQGYWSNQYGAQLETLGWQVTATTDLFDYFHKYSGDCLEKITIVSLGPNAQSWLDENNGDVRFEFELLAFSYEKSEECPNNIG